MISFRTMQERIVWPFEVYGTTSVSANRFPSKAVHAIGGKMRAVTPSDRISEPKESRDSSSRSPAVPLSSAAHAPFLQLLGRIALYALPALFLIRYFGIRDLDIWWHLATGRWILQHHAIPRSDPFSVFGMTRPWYVYSWVFDVVVQKLYVRFGFVGIILFEIVARVAIMGALFRLIYWQLPRFWVAAGLSGVSFYVMSLVIAPRPAMLTIFFGIIELQILLSLLRTGNTRKLWVIPPMLALWANWHIQFVYGLLILGVLAADAVVESIRSADVAAPKPRLREICACLLISALATLANPYGPRVYETVFQYMRQPKSFSVVVELRAMDFRQPQHFLALLLTLAAAMVIGWRRDTRLFWPALLVISAILAFRSVKEIWFVSLISASALADGWSPKVALQRPALRLRERCLVAVGALAVISVAYRHYDVSNNWLEMQVAGNFPESAARYIEKNHLTGPLYNDFNDGGFLIWRLPWLPVAIDGRTNVHGDDRVAHSSAVWSGKPGWDTDPELTHANIILAAHDCTFAALLRLDPRFRVVFEDIQTDVFQPR